MDRKTKKQLLKTGLAGLFLMTTLGAIGQTDPGTIARPPVNVGPVNTPYDNGERNTILNTEVPDFAPYEQANAVLFYNGQTSTGPGLTLVASKIEDLTDLSTSRAASSFTHYRWFYRGDDGTAAETKYGIDITGNLQAMADDPDNNKITVTNLDEGYHYFTVKGIVNPNNIQEEELCATQEETFVVYVLPELMVTSGISSTLTNGTNEIFQYCEIDPSNVGGQTKVQIVTTYDFVRPNTPTADNFFVKYRWYAIKADADGNYPTAVSNAVIDPESIPDVEILGTSTSDVDGGSLPNFFPQMTEIGKYKILVEVEYALKDRNENKPADVPTERQRDYVIYRGWAGGPDLAGATEITVTPQPGKPHITIEAVND